ncbi:LuxR C-terminal-related transcriptional regulator [Solirubrobacter taibaiensis]|nr:LuxR C-terminal-related transcriptional regulator [Solirubrobacter taibaiensis]
MGAFGMERGVERIQEAAARGSDLVTLWRDVSEIIAPLVSNMRGPCCFTLDPATLLMTSHFNPAMHYELPEEALRGEYLLEDAHDMASVARSQAGISTIHEATGGDPSQSPRWQANMTMNGDQELLLALRGKGGATWGCLGLYRPPGEKHFDAEQKRFLQSVAPAIGEGIRRALLIGEAHEPDTPDAPGLLVLTEHLEIESVTPGTERWLADLPGGDGERLPPAVVAVGGQALRSADGDRAGEVALARVLGDSGNWIVLHGATLVATGTRRVAVIVEPGHPVRIQPLLMAAYGLTTREQEVARLVLQGESTNGIGERLVVSPHTVQQHLKNIFEKTGVRSRRDLTGKVFFNHYEPRLRDNEQRVLDGRPLRGGPATGGHAEHGARAETR